MRWECLHFGLSYCVRAMFRMRGWALHGRARQGVARLTGGISSGYRPFFVSCYVSLLRAMATLRKAPPR